MLLHPRSKGYLKLKSRNPFHHPLFYPNFFNDSRDIDTLLEGIRLSIKIGEQPEFQAIGTKLYNVTVPGCDDTEFNTDEYWRCYIEHLSATLHHQIGTCKMGPISDKSAVVDANGRVHGIKNLRVADISILPESPSGHTAAFSFVIGEKIANNIRNDWSPRESNIQKLRRVRREVDWIYQDPEHTTELRTTSSTTQRPTHHPFPITNHMKPTTSLEMINLLHSLNMSELHEQSLQFQNSTIGDVGVILWGSLSASKNIDFKSSLAENVNRMKATESNTIDMRRRIFKLEPTITVTQSSIAIENEIESITPTNKIDKVATISNTLSGMDAITTKSTNIDTIRNDDLVNLIENVASTSTTEPMPIQSTSVGMSNMEKILATAPSLDEDLLNTYKLHDSLKYNISKAKFITKQSKHTAIKHFHDVNSTNIMKTMISTDDAMTMTSTHKLNETSYS